MKDVPKQDDHFAPSHRLRRTMVLVAAVVLQACLGAMYSWPVFVAPLRAALGLTQAQAQTPFTLFYVVFPSTMLVSWFLRDRVGSRFTAVIGALLFGVGWVSAGLFGSSLAAVAASIGAVAGIGAGIAYPVPIRTAMQWFPERRGLVGGIAVAGFGGGSALLSQIARYLMRPGGLGVSAALLRIGVGILIAAVLAGFALVSPASEPSSARSPASLSVVRSRPFLALFGAMFTGLAAGLAIVANLAQLAPADNAATAAAAVSIFAVFNAVGRVAWGHVHDRSRSSLPLAVNLALQALVLAGFAAMGRGASAGGAMLATVAYYLLAAAAGLNYGGVLVLYVSQTARIWGTANVHRIYGWMFFSNLPASLAPVMVAFLFDLSASFVPGIGALCALTLVVGVLTAGRPGRHGR